MSASVLDMLVVTSPLRIMRALLPPVVVICTSAASEGQSPDARIVVSGVVLEQPVCIDGDMARGGPAGSAPVIGMKIAATPGVRGVADYDIALRLLWPTKSWQSS